MSGASGPRRALDNRLRGERLRPSRAHRLHRVLTQLRRRLEIEIERRSDRLRDAVVVDYGCGNTPYRPLFEAHGCRYLGCDLPGNELADVVLDADGRMPLDDRSADVVLSNQTLEHVESPSLYLAECRRVLAADGWLILSTHGVWRYHPDPTDYWRWTADGLRRIVEEAGFEVEGWSGLLGPPAYALQVLQDSAAALLPRLLHPPLFLGGQLLVPAADALCSDAVRDRDAAVYLLTAGAAPRG